MFWIRPAWSSLEQGKKLQHFLLDRVAKFTSFVSWTGSGFRWVGRTPLPKFLLSTPPGLLFRYIILFLLFSWVLSLKCTATYSLIKRAVGPHAAASFAKFATPRGLGATIARAEKLGEVATVATLAAACFLVPIGWPSTDGSADCLLTQSRPIVGRLSGDYRPMVRTVDKIFCAVLKQLIKIFRAPHPAWRRNETVCGMKWINLILEQRHLVYHSTIPISRYLRFVNLEIIVFHFESEGWKTLFPFLFYDTINTVSNAHDRARDRAHPVLPRTCPGDCLKWVLHKNDHQFTTDCKRSRLLRIQPWLILRKSTDGRPTVGRQSTFHMREPTMESSPPVPCLANVGSKKLIMKWDHGFESSNRGLLTKSYLPRQHDQCSSGKVGIFRLVCWTPFSSTTLEMRYCLHGPEAVSIFHDVILILRSLYKWITETQNVVVGCAALLPDVPGQLLLSWGQPLAY